MRPQDPTAQYQQRLVEALRRQDATEHTHRPALKSWVESFEAGLTATNEPKRSLCGAPDFSIARGALTIGYIECKDVGIDLKAAAKTAQLRRYQDSLTNLLLTDYVDFWWYVNGDRRATASLGQWDGTNLHFDPSGSANVSKMLSDFLAQEPAHLSKPRELAERLARLTHLIRDVVVEALANGQASDDLVGLRQAFASTLLPDLDVSNNDQEEAKRRAEFADMYAQTLTYGLFAARCFHTGQGAGFRRLGAAADIPQTNPFLRRLFDSITGVALNEEPHAGLVDDLVQVLAYTDIDAVMHEFGRRNHREDPVVHFYETFLAAYDPRLRERRGVYYTPEPVVSYIVRSVDWLLKNRFGLTDGLADTTTVEVERTEADATGKEQTVRERHPKVLVLDPACGTGTFLYGVIDLLRESFRERGDAGMWPGFVREHLLPRLYGFELLMAPYAVAHLKLGLELAGRDLPENERDQWAYEFEKQERLNVFLTNTLEEAERHVAAHLPHVGVYAAIADEARAAARVKRDLPIMVVMGNPPYSNFGQQNRNPWILGLLDDYKRGLDEKKLNLDDDFIKFVRWAQWRIEQTGQGILAFITNHVYLDGLTHRRMRESLLETFDEIYVLDLHGNSRKKETPPAGIVDENVFDIQQGVAVAIMVRTAGAKGLAKVRHADLWGNRQYKHDALGALEADGPEWRTLDDIDRETCLGRPFCFRPLSDTWLTEYCAAVELTSVLPRPDARNGVKTDRDGLFVGFARAEVRARLHTFYTDEGIQPPFRDEHMVADSTSYNLLSRRMRTAYDDSAIRAFSYRPFDERVVYYARGLTSRPAWDVMRHMLAGNNLALVTTRQTADNWSALVGQTVIGHKACARYDICSVFPLYVYPEDEDDNPQQALFTDSPFAPGPGGRVPNLDPSFVALCEQRLGLAFVSDGRGDLTATFGPEDLLAWMYAIFWAPSYRERYADFLRVAFPRVPVTTDVELFGALTGLGHDLVALHLLEHEGLGRPVTRFPVKGDNRVAAKHPQYIEKSAQVRINGTQYFEGVARSVWEFPVGGYQPCERWLKDRRGRQLTHDDLTHYQRVVTALSITLERMAEVDCAIAEHGGWPLPGSVPD